jgi:hypothetical protein
MRFSTIVGLRSAERLTRYLVARSGSHRNVTPRLGDRVADPERSQSRDEALTEHQAGQQEQSDSANWKIGGAKRDRTADLLHAMQALSQLSYGPTPAWKAGAVSGSIPARMGGAPVFDGGF